MSSTTLVRVLRAEADECDSASPRNISPYAEIQHMVAIILRDIAQKIEDQAATEIAD